MHALTDLPRTDGNVLNDPFVIFGCLLEDRDNSWGCLQQVPSKMTRIVEHADISQEHDVTHDTPAVAHPET